VRRAAAFAASFALIPGVAHAQAYQCQVPTGPVSAPAVESGPVRHRPTTGYTLAVTWSPEYCRSRENSAGDSRQCSGRSGRFGMVVHGLWPEGRGADWPQWCPGPRPTGAELARNMCVTPSASLLANEWARHGSCMASRPATYLRVTRTLWSDLHWPDFDRLSRSRKLTAGDVRRAIAEANADWEPEYIGLVVSERGWLRELRFCYGRDFRPTRCDARRFGPRDSTPVSIFRGL